MEMPVEAKKESRTGAIIGTVAAIVLCGLPGLCLLCPAAVAIFANRFPDPSSSYGGTLSPVWGILPLCLSIVFIVIAVLVPVLTLRKKKVPTEPAPMDVLPPQEPLPPAS
jgi:cell division protein FtsX